MKPVKPTSLMSGIAQKRKSQWSGEWSRLVVTLTLSPFGAGVYRVLFSHQFITHLRSLLYSSGAGRWVYLHTFSPLTTLKFITHENKNIITHWVSRSIPVDPDHRSRGTYPELRALRRCRSMFTSYVRGNQSVHRLITFHLWWRVIEMPPKPPALKAVGVSPLREGGYYYSISFGISTTLKSRRTPKLSNWPQGKSPPRSHLIYVCLFTARRFATSAWVSFFCLRLLIINVLFIWVIFVQKYTIIQHHLTPNLNKNP